MPRVLGTYLLAQVPGWALAGVMLWGLQHWNVIRTGVAAGLLLVWIAKDVLLFPMMRRFYESEPTGGRMLGEVGIAVTSVARDGLVRVRGELWNARSEHAIPAGARVRVRGIEGLTLVIASASAEFE